MYKLLIADDELVEREALRHISEDNFPGLFIVELAENGRQAVEIASGFPPDIAILDIKMPMMSGIDAAREIIGKNPDCKVIMLTGFTYFNYARDCVRLGVIDFLVKPVPDEDVVSALRKALEMIGAQREQNRNALSREKKARLADSYMESELVKSIAFSGMDEEHILQDMKALGLTAGCGLAAILEMECPNNRPRSERRSLDILRQAVEQQSIDGLRVLLCERYEQIYLLLLSPMERDRLFFQEYFSRILKAVQQKSGFRAAVGIGTQVNKAGQYGISFREARKVSLEPGAIRFYKPETAVRWTDQHQMEAALCACLANRQYGELMQHLYEIQESIVAEGVEAQSRVYEVLVVLSRAAAAYIPVGSTYSLYVKLSQTTDVFTLQRLATQYVQGLIDQLIASEAADNAEWISNATRYIQNEYVNNVTLEDVAHHIGFSTYYFSRLFKQKFHTTFVEYLTGLRIQQAKKLLLEKKHTIKEVCYKVGYKEPNYFARVFKKETGYSPTEYQKVRIEQKSADKIN